MFFIQAEDGIRDRDVTGVQTCALPISTMPCSIRSNADLRAGSAFDRIEQGIVVVVERPAHAGSSDHACNRARSRPERSEERRVGKEGELCHVPPAVK